MGVWNAMSPAFPDNHERTPMKVTALVPVVAFFFHERGAGRLESTRK